jgi:hypothetical protein
MIRYDLALYFLSFPSLDFFLHISIFNCHVPHVLPQTYYGIDLYFYFFYVVIL